MPNIFIENRDAWFRMSEIDYVGQFVKTWLAFNAWYRNAYNESQDRKIINEIKWQGNPVLSKLRPMLEADSEEAEQFRAEIGQLHYRLENYELHSGKGAEKKRISLTSVFLKDKPPAVKTETYYGYVFNIERTSSQVKIEVKRTKGEIVVLQQTQNKFDLAGMEALAQFQQNREDCPSDFI